MAPGRRLGSGLDGPVATDTIEAAIAAAFRSPAHCAAMPPPATTPDDDDGPPTDDAPVQADGLTGFLGLPSAPAGHDALLGDSLGGVRIVRLIAEGGMGRVYEGLQERPRRTVAVKTIRPGVVSPRLMRRFEYEAQVLGRLAHPGIAHIHSVGVQEVAGATVPYFVMEYVRDARPLTAFANDRRLSTRERLSLFREVCAAVAHGHNRGIVHRDLKPGNILVDAEGRPKIIDFGVARSTDSDVALTTMHTDVGQLVGTLQYMCPEQFTADGDDIDLRADVYALGVVLYELLVGRPPYDLRDRPVFEVARLVRDATPARLSSFDRVLRGDLDTIAAKCLEKDRSRRYSNATELGADIDRYLAGEPIAARPPGLVDDLRRLIRRHRAVAAATIPLAAALAAAMVGLVFFAVAAHREGAKASLESDRARASERSAREAAAESERQRSLADEKAGEALRRLYVANVQSIPGKIAEEDVPRARGLVAESRALLAAEATPFELRYFAWLLDAAPVMLAGRAGCVLETSAGRRIAVTLSREDGPRAWDACTGARLAALDGHDAAATAAAASVDGRLVATGAEDGGVVLWDVDGWTPRKLRSGGAAVTGLAFSPDGSWLVCREAGPVCRLFGPLPAGGWRDLAGHAAAVTAAAFSRDGGAVATAAEDGGIRVWDTASATGMTAFAGHTRAITSIDWSLDGTRLATGSLDATGRVWTVADPAMEPLLFRHAQPVTGVAFSRDGLLLLTASLDQAVTVNPLTSTVLRPRLNHHGGVGRIAVSGDGRTLATAAADGVVRLWSMPLGTPGAEWAAPRRLATFLGHSGAADAVHVTADGDLVMSGGDDGTCRLWSPRPESTEPMLVGHTQGLDAIAFSPDGARVATASRDGTARIWDAATQRTLIEIGGAARPGRSIAFSPDGRLLLTGSEEPVAHLADADSGQTVGTFVGHEAGVMAVAFAPDGGTIATGSADGTARIWDARTCIERAVCRGHAAAVMSVAFAPRGERLATAAEDGSVRLWRADSGAEVGRCTGHTKAVRTVVFDRTGGLVATASIDGTARLWDAATGRELRRLAHRGEVHAAAFSPDAGRLATGSRDGSVRIWDVTRGDELAVLQRHRNAVVGLAFDPAGTVLASAAWDNTGRLWCGTRRIPASAAAR